MADAPDRNDEGTQRARTGSSGGGWLRRYPPLITFVAALLIMFLVMPSALNLPQANPTTVLEYAPVPPEEDDPPPPPQQGSLSDLSLGSSNTLKEGGEPEEPDVPEAGDVGEEAIRQTKECVDPPDGPPRQTEDPNSPPCVPFFEGDNGGDTYQGVTGDEITVLVYTSGSISVGGDSGYEESPDGGQYCDVDAKPHSQEECQRGEGVEQDHRTVRVTRALSRYFNARFQKYGRHVHFWVTYSSASSPSTRRSDAQDNWETLKPFAVIDNAFFGGFNAAYAQAMAKRNVTVYGSFSSLPAKFFRDRAPFAWGFWPDVQHAVEMYVDYVCKRVAPFESSYAGNDDLNGKERTYGLLSTSDDQYDGRRLFAELVAEELKKGCPNGASLDIAGHWKFPRHQYANDTHPDALTAARQNVAEMENEGVTTVLWLQGYETEHTKAMSENNYFPEIVVAGDLLNDQIEEARSQDQEAWDHAWIMTNQLRQDRAANDPCRQAYREVRPDDAGSSDEDSFCGLYRAFFMLFRGIQVAGPFLTPQAVDEGNHSIPASQSTSPYVAACFFDPGDYTCVKDAHEAWWDSDAEDPDGDPDESGCYRMMKGGKRYIAGEWPEGDAPRQFDENDPDQVCNNATDGTVFVNPYGPAG